MTLKNHLQMFLARNFFIMAIEVLNGANGGWMLMWKRFLL